MNYKDLFDEINEDVKERYELASKRISGIKEECKNTMDKNINNEHEDLVGKEAFELPKSLTAFFYATSDLFLLIFDLFQKVQTNAFHNYSLSDLKEWNHKLYGDIEGDNYETSFSNPDYVYTELLADFDEETSDRYAKILSFLNAEIRTCIYYAYESRLYDITMITELFIELYTLFGDTDIDIFKGVRSAIYYYVSDYSDLTGDFRTRETLDPELSFAHDIVMDSDLSDLRYLYQYGEYVSENEIKMAEHLNSMPQNEIDDMARTFTQGYFMGFVNGNMDLSVKKTVNIRFQLGFERMVRAAVLQFQEMGLKTIMFRAGTTARFRRNIKIGYSSTSPNNQYDYDHRYDKALFMDKALTDKLLVNARMAYENYEQLAYDYAGPAVIEFFGESPFEPKSKEHACKYDTKQEKLMVDFQTASSILANEFMNREQISFTIIAFPLPQIGENFQQIFQDTVKVNTLDMDLYKQIHQVMIDTLDQGDYVHIKGMNGNRTDLKVKLQELEDSSAQTLFENCLADVNIPVGEVFTSPKLEGTTGVLHVTEVYLNSLKYINLELKFEDGMIKEYQCGNFFDEEEGRKFIKENLLYNHDSIPMGEFAIGTNTTAYVMGKKFKISPMLPILIAEKTGPHFAVGDTCYHMSEDRKIYNPDGKEIVAKDNSCSLHRKTDISQAYFNCHTDITIPYDELGEITVYTKDNIAIPLLKEGRFVLNGTEELNRPLEEWNLSK